MTTLDLLQELFTTLDSSIVVDGNTIPVYIRGDQPSDVPSPSIIIEPFEEKGTETLDRSTIINVRLTIRIHDRKTNGWYATRVSKVKEEIVSTLRPSIVVSGAPVGMFQPDTLNQRYSVEGQEANDKLLFFDTFI